MNSLLTTDTAEPVKHTPGLWSLEQTDPNIARFHVGTRAENGNWYGIATDLAGEANARLIAAAPELYHVAGMLADVSEVKLAALTHDQLKNLVRDMVNEARAAIAKATGGAK